MGVYSVLDRLDCVYSLWYKEPTMQPAGDQQAASSVLYTTSCKHSLALLRMGEIIARNVQLIEIINKIIIVASSWLFILLNNELFYLRK